MKNNFLKKNIIKEEGRKQRKDGKEGKVGLSQQAKEMITEKAPGSERKISFSLLRISVTEEREIQQT